MRAGGGGWAWRESGEVGEAMEGAVSKRQKPSMGHFDKLSVSRYVTRCTRYIQTHPSGYLVSTGSGLLPLRPATACTSRRMAQ